MNNIKKTLTGLVFASPWIIGFLVLSVYPIAASFYFSMTDLQLMRQSEFIFLENYQKLMSDPIFWKSLNNTLYMTIIGTPIFLFTGLMMALLQNMKIKGQSFYRTIFYLPTIVPLIATSIIWMWILNPRSGLINSLLQLVGIRGPNWLGDPNFTKPSLIIIGAWTVGNIMIYFLAALQEIPTSLMESAEIDGASSIRKFFSIMLPAISPIILYQVIVNVIYNFQYFTQAYVLILGSGSQGNANIMMGTGGPENSLRFYALYLYQRAFVFFKMGEASAMAWLLFILVVIVTWIIFKSSNKWVTYGGE